MTNVRDYTTEELEWLTTLSFRTCKPGEFALVPGLHNSRLRLAELARRRDPFQPGVVVVLVTDAYGMRVKVGQLATVSDPARSVDGVFLRVHWDRRASDWQMDRGYYPYQFRVATPEDIVAFERSLKPQPVEGQEYRLLPYTPPPITNATHAGRRVRCDRGEAVVSQPGVAKAWNNYPPRIPGDVVICTIDDGYLRNRDSKDLELL